MKETEEIFISGSSSSRPIHVYLSFKADDETCSFTDMLWNALESNDLNTIWHDKNLDPGDTIFLPRHFLKAIRQSSISIVVLSKSYASSIWCLEELSEIVARIHEPRYTVFPIFYDVLPSEVQNQGNSFEKAFAEHVQRLRADLRKVHSWRLAMKQVGNLSGWHVPSEPGPQVIDEIIKEVKRKMRELVYAGADLVGMQSRLKEVEELLKLGSNDEIRVVGICGMGGVGKSTLVKVLYNRISHQFDASYLVPSETEFYKITGVRHSKRTLMVFDGIDLRLHLKAITRLIVKYNWLGIGSRIVITTRDEGLIKQFEKHDIYRVKLLTKDEALQLLCRKAFKCDFPMRGYEKQIESVLQYASGLPLAIVVLSQFLYNRRASEWSSALVEFKKVASSVIMKTLKKSFDELDSRCKEVFLDIACFFIGKEIKFVEGVLDIVHTIPYDSPYPLPPDSLHPVKHNMQLLIEKSLMANIDQKIQMHGLLQEMGREIVRHEFPSKPENWSRLWNFDDIYGIMQNVDTDNWNVKAIVLDLEDSQEKTLRVEGLSYMKNLRLLIFRNVKFSGVLERLTMWLQYISWHRYPFTSLPPRFDPYNLRELILPESSITNIWDEEAQAPWERRFAHLRNMNLSGSKDLTKMPNFEGFPRLERLDLEGCVKLSQLHPSIANSDLGLKFINLRNCTNLISIPNELFSLPSLEMLNLACCSKLANCLNFSSVEGIGENFEESFSQKRQNLCRRKSI